MTKEKTKILLVDDEENIRNIIASFLKKSNYDVVDFSNGTDFLESYHSTDKNTIGLIVLDIMLPDINGYELLKDIRSDSLIPVIMVSAKDSEFDKIKGLKLGSDDYMTKPFSPLELVARVDALIRRTNYNILNNSPSLTIGDLVFNFDKKRVHCHNELVDLSTTEYMMLEYLCKNQHRAVSRDELLKEIWGYSSSIKTRVTDDTLKRIRKKLKDVDSSLNIDTIWGFGFIIHPVESELI